MPKLKGAKHVDFIPPGVVHRREQRLMMKAKIGALQKNQYTAATSESHVTFEEKGISGLSAAPNWLLSHWLLLGNPVTTPNPRYSVPITHGT